jgi:hypothetical protein
MLSSAEPFALPCLFVLVNVAVQDPVVAPAVTTQLLPSSCVTVAKPVGPPQLSISETVSFLGAVTVTVAVGFEVVRVTEQGFTFALPWRVQLESGSTGTRACDGICVEV